MVDRNTAQKIDRKLEDLRVAASRLKNAQYNREYPKYNDTVRIFNASRLVSLATEVQALIELGQ